MSMNLCFKTKIGGHIVDFPFQTPTSITYAVMQAETLEDRIKLLKQVDYISVSTLNECLNMLTDETLELTML